VLFTELVASGKEANDTPKLGFTRGFAAIDSLFPGSQESVSPFSGNLSLPFSRIYTLGGGAISLLVPGGKVDVGLANPPTGTAFTSLKRQASDLGIVAQKQGDVNILAAGDVLVNSSRVFTLGGGDISIWSSAGNIDAGRGAKSAISSPSPTLLIDASGKVTINFSTAVQGSGIRTIITGENIKPGDVNLIAPAGFVNAGDAGIGSSGNLNIAAWWGSTTSRSAARPREYRRRPAVWAHRCRELPPLRAVLPMPRPNRWGTKIKPRKPTLRWHRTQCHGLKCSWSVWARTAASRMTWSA
jgi:hypothetical protein